MASGKSNQQACSLLLLPTIMITTVITIIVVTIVTITILLTHWLRLERTLTGLNDYRVFHPKSAILTIAPI